MTAELTSKKLTDGITDLKKDCIFNHPDCRKIFEDKVSEVRIDEGNDSAALLAAYGKVHMLIPNSQLNLSDDEFDQLHAAVVNNRMDIHSGIILKMTQLVGHSQPKDYADNPIGYIKVKHACDAVKKQINDLITPLRDECIETFYTNATNEQLDDIRFREKEANERNKHPMPGNPDMRQFNFNGQR